VTSVAAQFVQAGLLTAAEQQKVNAAAAAARLGP
jgi:hypothetical protein